MNKYCMLLLLALSGCGDKHVDPLVFGAIPWPGYEPAYVARELGYLDEQHVHLAEFTNSTEVVRAFRNGVLHIAGLTLDEALSLRQSIPDLQVFLVADVSNGADVLMVRKNISNLGQIKGKRIGVEKTALGAYFLSLVLQAAHLSPNDIQIVSLPLDEHENAFLSGQVDGVVTFGTERTNLMRQGAVVLFDSAQVPGKIVDTLVVRAADAERHRKHLAAFTKAWFRALQQMQSDPARIYPLVAQHEQAQVADIEEVMRGIILLDHRQNILQFSGNPPELLKTSQEIHAVLKEHNIVAGSDDLTQFINPSFLTGTPFD